LRSEPSSLYIIPTSMAEGDSFLPRIQSVFYAVFDVRQGPKIVYQVPEGLIAVPAAGPASVVNGNSSLPSTPSSDTPPLPPTLSIGNGLTSRNSSTSLVSPTDYYRPGGRYFTSLQKHSSSSQRTLFNFNDISMYVIPPPALCGRLVTCSTRRHRIIGFPVELKGKYERNYFRYNLCFVFEREADLSCYEPIVRKVSRVLKSCEVSFNMDSSLSSSEMLISGRIGFSIFTSNLAGRTRHSRTVIRRPKFILGDFNPH